MTEFDAVDALAKYKQAIWSVLLAHGAVRVEETERWWNDDIEYYGGNPNVSRDDTILTLEKIREVGINWTATTDPADHVGLEFAGTFCSIDYQVHYLKGILVLNDGSTSVWITLCSPDIITTSFPRILQMILKADPIEVALEKLEERLTNPETIHYFSYTCRIK